MRILSIISIALLTMILTGCGGGSGPVLPPGTRDLAGLEGTWTVNLSYSGTLGQGTVSDSGVGTWDITRNAIDSGFPLDWSYDGTTLNVEWDISSGNVDPICGTEITTVSAQLQINITPGSTSATISGTGTISQSRENCDDLTGTITYTGSMTL